jgi:hypothetical protein
MNENTIYIIDNLSNFKGLIYGICWVVTIVIAGLYYYFRGIRDGRKEVIEEIKHGKGKFGVSF